MFNKPTLFPKTPEPQIARSGRIGTAALSTGAAAAPVDNAAVRESGRPRVRPRVDRLPRLRALSPSRGPRRTPGSKEEAV